MFQGKQNLTPTISLCAGPPHRFVETLKCSSLLVGRASEAESRLHLFWKRSENANGAHDGAPYGMGSNKRLVNVPEKARGRLGDGRRTTENAETLEVAANADLVREPELDAAAEGVDGSAVENAGAKVAIEHGVV